MVKQMRYKIYGHVQGVGYRQYVFQKACSLGLKGYVRNLPDASVECLASGMEQNLDILYGSLKKGPPLSRVDRVEREENSQALESSFFIA